MVVDLSKLKGGQPGEAPTAIIGWLPIPQYWRPPATVDVPVPGMIVPVLTIEFIDTLDRKTRLSFPPDMVVPFIGALAGWAAGLMGGSAPQTPVTDEATAKLMDEADGCPND